MKASGVLTTLAAMTALSAAQTLTIPARRGTIISLSAPSSISGAKDFGNAEFDRGRDCNTDDDTGDENAVFVLVRLSISLSLSPSLLLVGKGRIVVFCGDAIYIYVY